jgi:hypothetical protein
LQMALDFFVEAILFVVSMPHGESHDSSSSLVTQGNHGIDAHGTTRGNVTGQKNHADQ